MTHIARIGIYVLTKYRSAARQRGTFTVAQQLRKQGYPLDVALAILTGSAA